MNIWNKVRQVWEKKLARGTVAVVTAVGLTAGVSACGTSTGHGAGSDTIVVGGKNFTEQDIMAYMMKDLIEHDTKLHVKMKTWLDSNVMWNAMKSGSVDVYVEYTGTGQANILKEKPMTDPQKVYDEVQKQFKAKYNITWLKPIGFNNTYAMAMTADEANKLGIKSISDLAAKSNQLTLGTEQDFITRADALPAMNKLYNTDFKSVKSMEIGLKYQALTAHKVDVIDAFSTDGNIPANHLVLLQDDKHLFPPYYAVPIIQDSVLKAHPELESVLNKLAGKIDDSEMQKLNAEVDIDHKKAADVADEWLKQNGLL